MIKVYWYPKCSTCIKAKKLLEKQEAKFELTDITINPPSAVLLKSILKAGEYPLKKLFNTSGQVYRALRLKEKLSDMTENEAVKLLSENGKLVKRPVITDGKTYIVGYDEAKIKKIA